MAQSIEFPREEIYLDEMNRGQLQAYLQELRQRIAALDAREPKNVRSDAYEAWAEEHEALEDAVDEVLDFLDEVAP